MGGFKITLENNYKDMMTATCCISANIETLVASQ